MNTSLGWLVATSKVCCLEKHSDVKAQRGTVVAPLRPTDVQ
jgi:hypothetical protein